jgi:hypothetical protein
MSTAISIKGSIDWGHGEVTEATLDEALNWTHPYNKHIFRKDIEEIRVKYDEETNEAVFSFRPEKFRIKINKIDGSDHYSNQVKALFFNNIGNIANICPQIARQIAEESNNSEESRLSVI